MVADYIEREALLEDIAAAETNGGMGAVVAGTLRRYVKRQPAADVAPVRHGHWVFRSRWHDSIDENLCSECGQMMTTAAEKRMPYCPNCGARMDGGTDKWS